MKHFVICFGFLLLEVSPTHAAVSSPAGLDDTVSILVVVEPGYSQAFVDNQLDKLTQAWNDFATGAWPPVSVTVLNGSTPIISPVNFTGNELNQFIQLDALISAPFGNLNFRNQFAADIVIAFVDHIPNDDFVLCGSAPMFDWLLGDFVVSDPATGLDTDGKDLYYMALVSWELPACFEQAAIDTAVHEFGHLFGAGHYEVFPGSLIPKTGLTANSRSDVADFVLFPNWPGGGWEFRLRSIMGSSGDTVCDGHNPPIYCQLQLGYSGSPGMQLFNDPTRNNFDAITTTGLSVANYRMGPPTNGGAIPLCLDGFDNDADGLIDLLDPDCLNGLGEYPPPEDPPVACDAGDNPHSVRAYPVGFCSQGATQYRVEWDHHCPEEVFWYEIWTTQPLLPPIPQYDWTVHGREWTDAFIWGSPARVQIRSCGNGGCSGISNSSTVLIDVCP